LGHRVYVGVLRVTIMVPGARSLKARRQVVRSLEGRIESRFSVSVHELPDDSHPGRQDLVMTTAGADGALVRKVLDAVRVFLDHAPDSYLGPVDLDVFPWHPAGGLGSVLDLDEEPWNG
jgi:uncharacterized protein YlxP (DUF503 family)